MNILPGLVFIFIVSNKFTLTFAYIDAFQCPQYPNECNVILSSEFSCWSSYGIYPDPTNCRVYYNCAGSSIPERYECPNGFIYNTWFQSCEVEPENVTDVCAGRRFDCDKPVNVETVVPYQFHPTYYAYCMHTAANSTGVYVKTMMLKCLYEELQEYTGGSMCRFACRQKGFFQNPERCQEYVYCSGDKAVPTVMQCPTNYVYDGTRCTSDKTKCLYP